MATANVEGVGYIVDGANAKVPNATERAKRVTVVISDDVLLKDKEVDEEMQKHLEPLAEAHGNSKTVNDEIHKKVDQINKEMLENESELVYGIHDSTNRVMIKVVDRNTKKVLKEYPPEKTLDMLAKVWEMAGLMVDEKR